MHSTTVSYILRFLAAFADFEKKMEKVIQMSDENNLMPFKEKAEEFVKMASIEIEAQKRRLDESDSVFRKALKYYKYTPKSGTLEDCTPSEFFELWISFVSDFFDIWKKELSAINFEMYVFVGCARLATY